jgi:hypothetical protein
MRVKTTTVIAKPPAELWLLLCRSKMNPHIPCYFRCGMPKPVECRLPDGAGGAGLRRECVSSHGVIHQRIQQWEEPRRLRFAMEDTTLYFRPCVTRMEDEFILEPAGGNQTRITRTTDITVIGFAQWAKSLAMAAGLKCIHRYVFKNWARPT